MSLADARDISIIILLSVQILFVLILIFVVLAIVIPLGKRIKEVADSALVTVDNIKTRSGFFADRVTKPTIRALGFITGVLHALNFITSRFKRSN